MIRFIYGKSGSGKTEKIFSEMARSSDRVFLLVPDREAVAAESRAAELNNAQNVDVLTFGRLCNYIFRRYGGLCVDYIGAGAKKLMMRNVMKTLSPALKEYADVNHFGIFEKMTELRTNCYHDKISPSDLENAAKSIGAGVPLGAKAADLGLIFSAFDAEVASRFEDPDGMISSAYALLQKHDFFEGADVFIDSFSSFSAQQYDILERIFRTAKNVWITFPFVKEERRESAVLILSETERIVRSTVEKAGKGNETEEIILNGFQRYKSEELAFLAENIVKNRAPAKEESFVPQDIQVVRAANGFSEAEAVALDICRAVRSGIRYRDIVVIVRDTSVYEGILDAVFRKYEIPF
ncbi:MAG: hypothetical protein IKW18_05405, partial [Clostridia bacterium]|nr:hypothetical protein [Clostridia bacterium]